jgi:hypothetical protein
MASLVGKNLDNASVEKQLKRLDLFNVSAILPFVMTFGPKRKPVFGVTQFCLFACFPVQCQKQPGYVLSGQLQ